MSPLDIYENNFLEVMQFVVNHTTFDPNDEVDNAFLAALKISKDEMPPAKAFWSLTLYDSANGFFIPNDRKKYSVGENGGMKLDEEGGIEIYVAAEKPEGVPEDNWLPINRKDENLDIILRIYDPDLEKMKPGKRPRLRS